MNWLIVVTVVATLAIGLFAWIIWADGGRNLGREAFSNSIRHLLVLRENGAFKRYNDRDSDFWFSIERLTGSDTSATLSLRIPRLDMILAVADRLQRTYESHGFEWSEQKDNPSLLAIVTVPVDDIWVKSSGAKGARAACLLLDVSGIAQDARFNIEEGGRSSDRWKKRNVSEL